MNRAELIEQGLEILGRCHPAACEAIRAVLASQTPRKERRASAVDYAPVKAANERVTQAKAVHAAFESAWREAPWGERDAALLQLREAERALEEARNTAKLALATYRAGRKP
jgi:hypothetical protein